MGSWTYWISRLTCNIVGNIYPAYASYKAVLSQSPEEHKQWLTYWIVNTVFTVFEMVADALVSWVPLYYETKIIFILWLTLPQFRGATILYEKFLSKYLEAYEVDIDKRIGALQRHAGTHLETLRQHGARHLRQKSGQVVGMFLEMVHSSTATPNTLRPTNESDNAEKKD